MNLSIQQRAKIDLILSRIKGNLEGYCRTVHPDTFDRPFSPQHKIGLAALDDTSIQRLLIIAHRGWGKSSIVNKAFPCREIVFETSPFIVPVSATATLALNFSTNLRLELRSNDIIKQLIGDVKSSNFSKEQWVTAPRSNSPKGICVMPRGTGQQVRGLNFLDYRPHRLIFDDLETKEGVMSEEQRDKTKNWFLTDFSQSVDQSKPWRIVGIGTILHQASLLQEMAESEEWTVLNFPIADPITGESNWPEYMTTEQIEEMKEEFRKAGKLEQFYLEYMNEYNPDELKSFKREYFRHFDPADLSFRGPDFESIILVDPARGGETGPSKTAIVGVTINLSSNAIYVRDIINDRIPAEHIYTQAFDMAERLDAQVMLWDDGGMGDILRHGVHNEMVRRGRMYTLEWAKNNSYRTRDGVVVSKDVKDGRIECLIPYYKMGQILHARGVCGVLEDQLLSGRKAKYKDVADAFSYVLQMMEIGERYMYGTDNDDEDEDTLDDTFAEEEKAFQKLLAEDEAYV